MLIGSNIIVREFEVSDLTEEYISWLNDPEITKFSNQRFILHNRATCQAYFESFLGSKNKFLAITYKKNNKMIGTMTVYKNLHHGTADVGIMIGDKNYWGQGCGQEAWDLVLIWLLNTVGVRKVTAGAMECNLGMIKLMVRSNMKLDAIKKEQEILDGVAINLVYYAKFLSD